MPINYIFVTCPQCGGTGGASHNPCDSCDGLGRVPVPSRIGDRGEPTLGDWIYTAAVVLILAGVIAFLIHHAK